MGTEPESKPRLCVDCKHYQNNGDCGTKEAEVVSLISGAVLHKSCTTLRYGGACGTEGKLWEHLPDAGKEPF